MASQTLISGGRAQPAQPAKRPARPDMLTAAARGPQAEGLWLTAGELALGLERSERWINQDIVPKLPAAAIRGQRPRRYRLRALLDLLEKRAPAPPAANEPPDLLDGPDSPALERYRRLKGDQLEMELAQARGELLTRSEVDESLFAFVQTLRSTADRLAKEHPAAAEILLDGLAELKRELAPPDADAAKDAEP